MREPSCLGDISRLAQYAAYDAIHILAYLYYESVGVIDAYHTLLPVVLLGTGSR